MKVYVPWGQQVPGVKRVRKLADYALGAYNPKTGMEKADVVKYGLWLISDALQEGELAEVRLGCKGASNALNVVIKGILPEVQQEFLEDIENAINTALKLSKSEGGIDLDSVHIYDELTVGGLLRHGASEVFTPEDPYTCERLAKLLKRIKTFLQHVATINTPYYPAIETSSVNLSELRHVLQDAFDVFSIAETPEAVIYKEEEERLRPSYARELFYEHEILPVEQSKLEKE